MPCPFLFDELTSGLPGPKRRLQGVGVLRRGRDVAFDAKENA